MTKEEYERFRAKVTGGEAGSLVAAHTIAAAREEAGAKREAAEEKMAALRAALESSQAKMAGLREQLRRKQQAPKPKKPLPAGGGKVTGGTRDWILSALGLQTGQGIFRATLALTAGVTLLGSVAIGAGRALHRGIIRMIDDIRQTADAAKQLALQLEYLGFAGVKPVITAMEQERLIRERQAETTFGVYAKSGVEEHMKRMARIYDAEYQLNLQHTKLLKAGWAQSARELWGAWGRLIEQWNSWAALNIFGVARPRQLMGALPLERGAIPAKEFGGPGPGGELRYTPRLSAAQRAAEARAEAERRAQAEFDEEVAKLTPSHGRMARRDAITNRMAREAGRPEIKGMPGAALIDALTHIMWLAVAPHKQYEAAYAEQRKIDEWFEEEERKLVEKRAKFFGAPPLPPKKPGGPPSWATIRKQLASQAPGGQAPERLPLLGPISPEFQGASLSPKAVGAEGARGGAVEQREAQVPKAAGGEGAEAVAAQRPAEVRPEARRKAQAELDQEILNLTPSWGKMAREIAIANRMAREAGRPEITKGPPRIASVLDDVFTMLWRVTATHKQYEAGYAEERKREAELDKKERELVEKRAKFFAAPPLPPKKPGGPPSSATIPRQQGGLPLGGPLVPGLEAAYLAMLALPKAVGGEEAEGGAVKQRGAKVRKALGAEGARAGALDLREATLPKAVGGEKDEVAAAQQREAEEAARLREKARTILRGLTVNPAEEAARQRMAFGANRDVSTANQLLRLETSLRLFGHVAKLPDMEPLGRMLEEQATPLREQLGIGAPPAETYPGTLEGIRAQRERLGKFWEGYTKQRKARELAENEPMREFSKQRAEEREEEKGRWERFSQLREGAREEARKHPYMVSAGSGKADVDMADLIMQTNELLAEMSDNIATMTGHSAREVGAIAGLNAPE
jgi:hypothetical protein